MLVHEFWKIPFLRLIIPFVTGIIISDLLSFPSYLLLGFSLLFIAIILIYRPFFNHSLSYHKRWIFGFFIFFAFLFTGSYIGTSSKQHNNKITESQMLIGTVNDPPQVGINSVKFPLKIREYKVDGIWYQANEKIIVNIENDSISRNLEYGNLLLLKGNLKEISNPGNPSEFDYKKYLERKHIYYKSFQNKDEWALIDKNCGNPIFSFAYKIRSEMLNIYRNSGISGDEFGLLAALTLGTKDYLSDEIIEAYSESGAMHVLSVSGLHVGIIFIVLNQLLFFLRKTKVQQILSAVIIILVIWFFALLTGLSPSVNRAAAMISIVIIGKASKRKPSTYNSVAVSAFILLFIDPMFLFDVGFQLSYLAVISLIFFYQRIYFLIEVKNYLLDKIWSLTCVSIAAQIGTTALSIYYFHQFPVYAILSNLIVVPVSFVVMVLAIILLATSFILPVGKIVALLLSNTISFLNGSTKFIEELPMSTIESISLNGIESLCIHISILLFMVYIVTKNKKLVTFVLISLALAFAFRDIRFIDNKMYDSFSVYNVPRKSAFSIIQNNQLKLFADSSLYVDLKAINYLTTNIMASKFITDLQVEKIDVTEDRNAEHTPEIRYIVNLNTIKLVFLQDKLSKLNCAEKLKVNYIIVSNKSSLDIEAIQNLFEFDMLIADASVPKWKLEILKRDCQKMEIPYYNVSESGAFVCQVTN